MVIVKVLPGAVLYAAVNAVVMVLAVEERYVQLLGVM